ncbi:hypothetical protein ATZ36_11880 [Candidatus Endomicrobiellum trichonymphae]|uniref:Uncharacterized protein n=1 Tax=Endomicrobium trichonymphae TaxID=1408204 RepID=A0A1E5IN46_ENDTX|nr:hypothetical protein ATZ36_11880 [Candidatus Endomicrobium trichonymphae]
MSKIKKFFLMQYRQDIKLVIQISLFYFCHSYFDEIVANGIVFTNDYANGTRSIFGLSASFLSTPMMPGMLSKIERLELINNVSSMSEAFNERGYFTMFVQSSARNSLRMHVQESCGKENMPRLMNYMHDLLCGYDYDLFDLAAEKAASNRRQGRPFFIFH